MNDESLQTSLKFLDSWLGYRARQVDIPGFCVAISYRNSQIFSRAYGLADIERNEPMTPQHLFGMASQSKMFTSTAILQLVEQNKLRLDDFIVDYLPWLSRHPDKRICEVTVAQLLNHRAGLVRDGLDAAFWGLKQPFPSAARLRKAVLTASIALEPNTQLKYSNLGYALLGQVIEAASEQSYTAFISDHIIKQLKLTNTSADYRPVLAKRLATAYGVPFEHRRTVLEPRLPTKALAAAVGIHATAEAMCQFASAHFFGNEALLSDRLKKEAQRSQWVATRGYDSGMEFGLGFEIQMIGDRRVVGHGGHLAGFCTATFFDPHAQLVVAVTTNCKDAPSTQIVRGVFEALDWFAANADVHTPRSLERFSARLHNVTSAVEIVATKRRLAVIDPDDWEPFTWLEELERLDANTLRIVTLGSIFNQGELIHYTFAHDAVQAVRYAGFTMVPEPDYRRSTADFSLTNPETQLTLDDLQHITLRIGRVLQVEPCKGSLQYRLLIDFGPELGTTYAYLPTLPRTMSQASLPGQPVLGAVFPVWHFGTYSNEVLVVGLKNTLQASAPLAPGTLFALTPDATSPRTLWPAAASERSREYLHELRHGFFKFQALEEYPPEDHDSDTSSLTAWLQGKQRKSLSLMNSYKQNNSPFWLQNSHRRQDMRIVITPEVPTAYLRWYAEFARRVAAPLGETIYMLPRQYLHNVEVPEADFTIWDNRHVMLNGYAHGRWTHTTIYDTANDNTLEKFLKLRQQLLRVVQIHGQKLVA